MIEPPQGLKEGAFRDDDPGAWGKLLGVYVVPALRAVGSIWFGGLDTVRDAKNVDDLVQETCLRLWRTRASFDCSRPVLPWAKKIMLNLYLTMTKRERPTAELTEDSEASTAEDLAQAVADAATFDEFTARLPPRQRVILVSHFYEGEPMREIAMSLELSETTIRNEIHRIRGAFESWLREHPDSE